MLENRHHLNHIIKLSILIVVILLLLIISLIDYAKVFADGIFWL
jgi:hypothetical protein